MGDRIRVARVIDMAAYRPLQIGGTELGLYQHLVHIDRDRFDLRVVAPPSPLTAWYRDAGCEVHHLGPRKLVDSGYLVRLARYLRRNRIEILHCHLLSASVHGRLAAILAGTPVVITNIHNSVYQMFSTRGSGVGDRFLTSLLLTVDGKTTCLRTDATIALSRENARDLIEREGIPPERVRLIHNEIDTDRFHPSRRRHAAMDSAPLRLVAIGRLEPQKDYATLLKALALVRCDYTLALAGAGSQEESLRHLAGRLGIAERVRFLGHVRRPEDVLAEADCLAHSAIFEGFGRAIAEAMAMEIPVIATGVDGIPDVVIDGDTGFLVPPSDPIAMALEIDRFATLDSDERAAIGRAARAHVVANFGLRSIIDSYERLYIELRALARERRERRPGWSQVVDAIGSDSLAQSRVRPIYW